MMLDKEEFIQKSFPYMSVISISQDYMVLRDDSPKGGGFKEVHLKDHQLYCDQDKSFNCDHVHYVYALPEVASLGLKRPPAKRPQRSDFPPKE